MKKIILLTILCLILINIGFSQKNKIEKQNKINKTIAKEIKKEKPKQIIKPKNKWKCIGKQRITCYCPSCNDPNGYQSSSGKRLRNGYAACNWLPIGTKINIEGEYFKIMDKCGTDAIDVFTDTPECQCNLNEYREVCILSGDELD